ncbi:hypothetical protein ACFFTN_09165 [Aminobacter aganoensis]|uniref:Uncharacterized protein n=1 Tax=Aminobacter aganoensis TaxID=83264 RepID=A0A7X0F813_9HYPH|nr:MULTISPECIES: hypothetical protein [Aminobacter]KQU76731.1 hypothetical protein ASC75_02495 [Aminobacter sp. DSM 101952]MBB6354851.1 hypothetical protein [Aminobacter aganoensis]
MFDKIKTAALSALIGFSTLAAIPASAQADGLYLNLGQGEPRVGIYVQDGYRDGNRWDNRNDGRWDNRNDGRWGNRPDHGRWDRRCTPDRALDKADRMGLRRARVVDVNRRTITVSGRKYGERVAISFARAPNCPVVRW